jgi:hypothetical protein
MGATLFQEGYDVNACHNLMKGVSLAPDAEEAKVERRREAKYEMGQFLMD